MLFLIPLLATLAAPAAAQNASAVTIEGLVANFQQAQLVPELLPTFTPQGLLNADFGNGSISVGQALAQTAVANFPTLTVSAESNATAFAAGDLYTVILTDANPVGTDESTTAQTRHWLVNGASLSGSAPYAVNFTGSTAITDYAGPGPAAGSGAHRYVLLLYSQPSTFAAPANLSTAGTALGTWFVDEYASSSGLGDVVAANYFTVENGVATITVASTTAVNTATLPGAASSTSKASGASGSASASKSASSGSASASASAKSGAERTAISWGLGLFGAVVAFVL